jgi:hypothetical protein
LLGTTRHDALADIGAAGEADLGDVRVLDQTPPRHGTRPDDDLEHTGRESGLER